ncbi:Uncharacterised protein [Legionella pneumophila]|nr:Uncharacterised protein [Legionella pneumophila]
MLDLYSDYLIFQNKYATATGLSDLIDHEDSCRLVQTHFILELRTFLQTHFILENSGGFQLFKIKV